MSDRAFEAEVLRVARAMWPAAAASGARMVAGRERDGVFVTDDQIHVLEATTGRSKQKAEKDAAKLDELTKRYGQSSPTSAVKGWLVTLHEPTADQRSVVKKLNNVAVVIMSFDQFRAHLIDAKSYMDARTEHPFGSARSLQDDSVSYGDPGEYVPLDILEPGRDESMTVGDIADQLLDGANFVLLGDYGAGKSMTMRQLFRELRKRYLTKKIPQFPIHLNLREHAAQTEPAEALQRHAAQIGFESPAQIVRAWKSGYGVLLLDGFDEMATVNWSGGISRLRDVRRRAVQLVANFLAQSPTSCGVMVAGREHYFDSDEERRSALRYGGADRELTLNDFSDEQIVQFLQRESTPAWLPRRPLLLGYLAARQLLPGEDAGATPAEGWNELIDRVCEREAAIDVMADGPNVRRMLERIASFARSTTDGLGPVTFQQIGDAFTEVVGYTPDEGSLVLLQRLPGLGVADAATNTRTFFDVSWAEALQSGDSLAFACNPYLDEEPRAAGKSGRALGDLGVEVASLRYRKAGYSDSKLAVALRRAAERGWSALAADLARMIEVLGAAPPDGSAFISGIWIEELQVGYTDLDLSEITFQDCAIQHLDVNAPFDEDLLPRFAKCVIGTVSGVTGYGDLPASAFADCAVDEFGDTASTNQGIRALNIPDMTQVVLILLKKLYAQRGAGRRDSALRRGMDDEMRQHVDEALKILVAEDLVTRSKQSGSVVWLPMRSQSARVRRILGQPMSSTDPVILRADAF